MKLQHEFIMHIGKRNGAAIIYIISKKPQN